MTIISWSGLPWENLFKVKVVITAATPPEQGDASAFKTGCLQPAASPVPGWCSRVVIECVALGG